MIDFDTFRQHFEDGKSQLVWIEIPGDLETPVSAFLKLCNDEKHAFLLESVEGGETLSRYSIIGFDPDLIWQPEDSETNPRISLQREIDATYLDICPNHLPPMAAGGLFGYLGYDCIRWVEKIPDENPDPLGLPEAILIRPSVLTIFDNVTQTIFITCPVHDTAKNGKNAGEVYQKIQDKLKRVVDRLDRENNGHKYSSSLHSRHDIRNTAEDLPYSTNMPSEDYKDMVRKGVEYIHAGDIFQVVLSQRMEMPFDLPPFELYRSLRRLNPSPFLFFLRFNDFCLIGSSPEVLVRVREGKVTIRPIAGTRPRGQTPKEDTALAEELLADHKECAEHLMLLDLGRNDVGHVCKNGSVKVTDSFKIENYSHVMHIVSNVEGDLKEDTTPLEAFFSGFPAGTVSGAPKIRAMEIIDELEPLKRGFYAGSIGYFDGRGNIDSCIALRTGLVKDGLLTLQAGAGVVADSDPENENLECHNKAKALYKAAQDAKRRLK